VVVIDPAIDISNQFGPAPKTQGTSTFRFERVPFVQAPEILVGEAFRPTVYGEAGQRAWLFASLATFPRPTPLGELWVDPGATCYLGSGVLQAGAGSHGTWTVPLDLFAGRTTEVQPAWGENVTFQALYDDGTRLRLALPVVSMISARRFPWPF
jgi:hypothetical protein